MHIAELVEVVAGESTAVADRWGMVSVRMPSLTTGAFCCADILCYIKVDIIREIDDDD